MVFPTQEYVEDRYKELEEDDYTSAFDWRKRSGSGVPSEAHACKEKKELGSVQEEGAKRGAGSNGEKVCRVEKAVHDTVCGEFPK